MPSLITAFIAIRELVPGRELRRAQEMVALEHAMAAAKARDDSVYHAYRAHALARVQAAVGNPFAPAAKAMLWGLAALVFFAMTMAPTTSAWYVQLSAMAGAAASAFLAASNAGKYAYNSRTKQPEAAQALDLSLAAARQDLVDSAAKLPALKQHPDLASKARASWKRMNRRQKVALIGMLFAIAVFFIAGDQLENLLGTRDVTRTEAIEWAARLGCWATALLVVYNVWWEDFARRLTPRWLSIFVFWGGQVVAVAALFIWGQANLAHELTKWRFASNPTQRDFAMTMAFIVWAPTVFALTAQANRFGRWRQRRSVKASSPTGALDAPPS